MLISKSLKHKIDIQRMKYQKIQQPIPLNSENFKDFFSKWVKKWQLPPWKLLGGCKWCRQGLKIYRHVTPRGQTWKRTIITEIRDSNLFKSHTIPKNKHLLNLRRKLRPQQRMVFESGFTGFSGLTITSLVWVGRLLIHAAFIARPLADV